MTQDLMTDNAGILAEVKKLREEVEQLKASQPEDKLSMVVFSGDLDKLLAAFIIATGAAVMYEKVVMFFTFWATAALRDPKKHSGPKDFMSKMFGFMLPKGASKVFLSKMNMGGMGTTMLKGLMQKKNVMMLEQLIKTAAESNVELYVCQMSMELMGFTTRELIDYPNMKVAGVGKFLGEAGSSRTTLFI
ncbi:MAG: DsrE/DsrF/DrsH-like family protein [Candidatus Eremiobacteraeota bacterium]|nr:DsrE/DsrF/DrsH-like family protein [Candidatus Eremiobacteraeota bacterium]